MDEQNQLQGFQAGEVVVIIRLGHPLHLFGLLAQVVYVDVDNKRLDVYVPAHESVYKLEPGDLIRERG